MYPMSETPMIQNDWTLQNGLVNIKYDRFCSPAAEVDATFGFLGGVEHLGLSVSESSAWFGDAERLEKKNTQKLKGLLPLYFSTFQQQEKDSPFWWNISTWSDETRQEIQQAHEFEVANLMAENFLLRHCGEWWRVRTIWRTPKSNDSTKFRLNFHLPNLSGRWEVSFGVSYLLRYRKILSISKSLQQAKANVVVMA